MNITAIRVGRTFNLGNYESRKIEIEAIPDNGQTFDAAMAEVNALVEAQGQTEEKGATTKKPAAKKDATSSAPPLAKTGAKSVCSDPTTTPATTTTNEPPFEPGSDVAAEPAPKAKRGRKAAKVPDHEKELQYVLDSESLEELAERFNNLRTMSAAFGSVDNWEGALSQVADRYRMINSPTSDPAIVNQIVAGFKAEKTSITEQRKSAA